MTPRSRSALRFATTLVVAAAAVVEPQARADPDGIKPPKVEFVEVAGRRCLQPVVNGAGAALADYRAAELRWLASKYPGVPTPRAKTELLLSPDATGVGQPERTTVQRETFYLEGIVGPGAVVCFDIGLLTKPGVR